MQTFYHIWLCCCCCCSVTKSCLTLCNPWTAARQAFCSSLSPWICSNSCPLSQWCHPIISSSVAPSSLNLFQHQGLFNELALCIRWPKYWSFSFSINPSQEYSGWISLRIDWFGLFAVQGTPKHLLDSCFKSKFESISYLALILLYDPTVTSVHDHWKNHSFDYMDLYQQSDVSAF